MRVVIRTTFARLEDVIASTNVCVLSYAASSELLAYFRDHLC